MPWSTTSVSTLREQFVMFARNNPEVPLSATCRRFGVSRPTGYKWLYRYDPSDPSSLCNRSNAPVHPANATDPSIVEAILALRAKQPTSGPRKLLWRLYRDHPDIAWPCASTIGAFLKDHGRVQSRRRRRHPDTARVIAPTGDPNDLWTIDYKGQFQTANSDWCYPLTMLDACSRFNLSLQAFPRIATDDVRAVMEVAFREFGLPRFIKSDNGPPFGSTGVARLSRLGVWWIRLGIRPCPIQPSHPEQNGAHERFHRTLREDTASPPSTTLRAQQERFRHFRHIYNTDRPHEALGMNTPASVYQASPRPFPERLQDLVYPDDAVLRYVHTNGCLRFQGQELFLSETLKGQTVGLLPVDADHWVVCFGPVPLTVLSARTRSWLAATRAEPILAAYSAREGLSL